MYLYNSNLYFRNKKSTLTNFNIVKITFIDPVHTYSLSNTSFRTATYYSKSTKKANIQALKVVIECMKLDLYIPAIHLRPLLSSCLPSTVDLSLSLLIRVRRRCQSYLVSQPDTDSLDVVQSNKLLSTSDLSQNEIDVLDVPQVKTKYGALYGTIMTNGSEF